VDPTIRCVLHHSLSVTLSLRFFCLFVCVLSSALSLSLQRGLLMSDKKERAMMTFFSRISSRSRCERSERRMFFSLLSLSFSLSERHGAFTDPI